MRHLVVLACLAAGLLSASSAAAQEVPPSVGDPVVVVLKSGAALRGTVVEQSQGGFTLRLADGSTSRLNYDNFTEVRRDEEALARLAPAAKGAAPSGQPIPAAPRPPIHVGLGVALLSADGQPSFFVPMQVSPAFRIEPEIGLARFDVNGDRATAVQLGLGLLRTAGVAPQVGVYGGLRVQFQRFSVTGGEASTNLRLAAVLGGEWQPVPQVALGAEAQAAYLSADKGAPAGAGAGSTSATGLATAGLLFFRVFLD